MEITRAPIMVRKRKPITIANIISELIQLEVKFTDTELKLAKISKINIYNGPYFNFLVKGYRRGDYNKDISVLGNAIKTMLRNTASYSKG